MPTMSLLRNGLLAAAAIGGLLAGTVSAQAAPTTLSFDLTCGIGGPPCGTTVYGTITLTQENNKTVLVSETLAAGNVFAGGGAGDALAFNVSKPIVLTNIQPAAEFAQSLSPKGVPYGTFGYAIDYLGNGTSPPTFTSFSFTTSDNSTLSIADFVANTDGYYFVSDIGIPKGNGKFNTGNVASKGPSTPNVPEPASLALLSAGLLGLGMIRRRTV